MKHWGGENRLDYFLCTYATNFQQSNEVMYDTVF